jgi:putative peptidoglycan lipid II flippase
LLAAGIVLLLQRVLGDGFLGSLAGLVLGAGVLGVGYLLLARRMRVTELDEIVGPLLVRLGR